MGINYGTLGDNLPSVADTVTAIKAMKFGRVKLFNPNPDILGALANTGLEVVVTLPNEEIVEVGASLVSGESWVERHIAPYYPAANIVTILIGNEIFTSDKFQSTWTSLVPATQNIHAALRSRGWSGHIKISTAVALDVLATSFPPSAGTFRADIAISVLQPFLSFLTTTNSYLFVNVYPFLTYTISTDISLGYAMFSNTTEVNDGGRTYTNLMDAQIDAVYAASTHLGFPNLRIAVGETGWPTAGDVNQTGATVDNAALYNRRLVLKVLSTTHVGTPARPGVIIPTYIFSLFNENLKPGVGSERNWGLLYPDLTPVYAVDLTGQLLDHQYAPNSVSTGPPSSPSSAGSGSWCVSSAAADPVTLENGLNYACNANEEFCAALQPGQSCHLPNTVASHASWAFNSYWQKYRSAGGSCSFDGAATLTSIDPSKNFPTLSLITVNLQVLSHVAIIGFNNMCAL